MKRETVFLLGFGLRMSTEDVSDFLTRVLREQDFDFHNPEEVIYWYCYRNHLGYYKAEEYKETYKQMAQGFVWTVKKSFWNIWLF